jgi:hypothetical protein
MKKRYRCERHPNLSLGGIIRFVDGELVTDDAQTQATVERSVTFLNGVITAEEINPPTVEIVVPEPESKKEERAGPSHKYPSQMTQTELRALARGRGLKVKKGMMRRQLYKLVKDAEA